jgi:hypothetical protein
MLSVSLHSKSDQLNSIPTKIAVHPHSSQYLEGDEGVGGGIHKMHVYVFKSSDDAT